MKIFKKYWILSILIVGNGFGQTDTINCKSFVDSLTNTIVYDFVDKMPEPDGGMENLISTLMNSLEYHTQATVYGRIYVDFIVNIDGKIIGKRILKSPVGNDFAEQILSNIDQVNWISGSCNGVKVPVLFKLPVIIDVK